LERHLRRILSALLVAPTTRPGQRNPRGDAREASAAAEAYEELGQRLAVITLALHAIERGGAGSAPAAAIRLAVDEARRQVRFLCGRGERPGTTSIAGLSVLSSHIR